MNQIQRHPINNSFLYTIFIKRLIKNGKRIVSENILKNSFNIIKNITKKCPLLVLENSIKLIKIPIKFISNKFNYNFYTKHSIISNLESVINAVNWIISFVKNKKGLSCFKILANEILKLYNNESFLINKRFNYIKNSIFEGVLFNIVDENFLEKKKFFVSFKKFKRKFFLEKTIVFRLNNLYNRLKYIKSFY